MWYIREIEFIKITPFNNSENTTGFSKKIIHDKINVIVKKLHLLGYAHGDLHISI